jgi:uncharacterized protein (TIGR03382 family)
MNSASIATSEWANVAIIVALALAVAVVLLLARRR